MAVDRDRAREPLRPQEAKESVAPIPRRAARPPMRSAVVWAEILGKPKALKNRR